MYVWLVPVLHICQEVAFLLVVVHNKGVKQTHSHTLSALALSLWWGDKVQNNIFMLSLSFIVIIFLWQLFISLFSVSCLHCLTDWDVCTALLLMRCMAAMSLHFTIASMIFVLPLPFFNVYHLLGWCLLLSSLLIVVLLNWLNVISLWSIDWSIMAGRVFFQLFTLYISSM